MRVNPLRLRANWIGACCLVALAAESAVSRGNVYEAEDQPAPIKKLQSRTEETADQLRAAALYATGRALFQRGETAAALKYYQRALRWDPEAAEIAGQIVPLAFSLKRPHEAVRYALLSAERYETDPLLLRRLALYVTEIEDWPRAARLYRKWLSHPETVLDPERLETLLVWLEVGRLEYLNGNAQQASKILGKFQKAVLQAEPDSPAIEKLTRAIGGELTATWELCAMAHVDAKSYGLAAEALDEINVPLEEAGRFGYRKALVAMAQDQPLKAWEHLREYFRLGHANEGIGPFELLKELLERLNQGETIILELAKLRAEMPHNDALAIALAGELASRGETEHAIELYQTVATHREAKSRELVSIACRELFVHYADQGSAPRLLDLLHLTTLRLGDAKELETAFEEVSQKTELIDGLIKEVNRSELDMLSSSEYSILAKLMLVADRVDVGQRYFQTALRLKNDQADELILSWGLELIAAEEYKAASTVLQQGVENQISTDDEFSFRYYLSAALELAGNTDKALEIARQAAEAQPDSVEIAARVPWILYHAKRYSAATKEYEALLAKYEGENKEAIRKELRDARFSLSNLAVLNDDIFQASEWLETILDEYPDDVGAMNDLGYLWADQQLHPRHAERLVKRAVAEEPENAAYRDSLGWVYHKAGKSDAAIRELTTAVELSSRESEHSLADVDPVIMDHLGDAYLQAGQSEQAAKWWQQALASWQLDQPDKAAIVEAKLTEYAKKSVGNREPRADSGE